jgi:hypothetical protein
VAQGEEHKPLLILSLRRRRRVEGWTASSQGSSQ